ncbi:MAG TPA: signal recognition particle-docking protein FtsY [Candidatus Binatia bacterium]|nr:signal recognition particle-docking protein FtsY [Candidatus Binatia bacterium]
MGAGAVALLAAGLAGAAGVAVLLWRRRRLRPPSSPATGAPAGRPRPIGELLRATSGRLTGQLDAALKRGVRPLDAILAEVEEALVAADVGTATATMLLRQVRSRLGQRADAAAIRAALAAEMEVLLAAEPPPEPTARPWVILVTGVNGVGKTTTVGKLAALHSAAGRRVLIVAADTFRAAAAEQLAVWAERTGADLVRHAAGASPSAVIFDGMRAAVARSRDVVLVDTAGRLHTRENLMEELGKVRRIIAREVVGAPHETLLVLDATTGQNALNQARAFGEIVRPTGVVLTKLDGTARGGVVLAVRQQLGVPVRYLGVGEGPHDLRAFDAREFVEALLAPAPREADGAALQNRR